MYVPLSCVPLRVAAVDVGSNSIRQLVADVGPNGYFRRVHEDREVVRLGTGAFRRGSLETSTMAAAYAVLHRMSAHAAIHDVAVLRAVGTSALRDAANRDEFVHRASAILGAPLEIISGHEEALLVGRGVSALSLLTGDRSLIVDVGGGSAQLIVSDGARVLEAFSVPLGAVRLTESFLTADPAPSSNVAQLADHVRAHLSAPLRRILRLGVTRMVCTSATAGAIVCAVNGVKRSQRRHADGMIASASDVREFCRDIAEKCYSDRAATVGIGRRRAEVIVAGAVVVREILALSGLPSLEYSTAGLREGVVLTLAAELLAGPSFLYSPQSRGAVA